VSQSRQPLRSGDLFYRAFQTSQGFVELLAEVDVDGATLHLKDIAVYPQGAMAVTVGVGEVIVCVRQLRDEARAQGFAELRLTGVRYSGARPGKSVDIRINLARLE
jgi:hypothetical protein